MDLRVPSRRLSALAISHLGANWEPFSLSRGLAGKGPGWAGGLPAAKGGRVRRDQSRPRRDPTLVAGPAALTARIDGRALVPTGKSPGGGLG